MSRLAPLTLLLLTAAIAQAGELRDPTRPATLGRPAVTSLESGVRLEAVLGTGEARRAIVNGRIVRAGERVGNVLITSITDDSIQYVQSGRTLVAKLPTQKVAVRKPSALHAGEP
jgi:hypothetical protein